MRVVADTNTLISGFLFNGKERKLLKLFIDRTITLLTSRATLAEFRDVISREKFGQTKENVEFAVNLLEQISVIVPCKTKLDIIKDDLSDNKFFECAIDGKADYVVSGDKHVLNIPECKGIKAVRTRDILKEFDS